MTEEQVFLAARDLPDPQAQERYGAKITYDLDLTRDGAVPVLGFLKTSAETG